MCLLRCYVIVEGKFLKGVYAEGFFEGEEGSR